MWWFMSFISSSKYITCSNFLSVRINILTSNFQYSVSVPKLITLTIFKNGGVHIGVSDFSIAFIVIWGFCLPNRFCGPLYFGWQLWEFGVPASRTSAAPDPSTCINVWSYHALHIMSPNYYPTIFAHSVSVIARLCNRFMNHLKNSLNACLSYSPFLSSPCCSTQCGTPSIRLPSTPPEISPANIRNNTQITSPFPIFISTCKLWNVRHSCNVWPLLSSRRPYVRSTSGISTVRLVTFLSSYLYLQMKSLSGFPS